MLPSLDDLKAAIERGAPRAAVQVESGSLWLAPQDLLAVGRFLKDSPTLRLDDVSDVTAVDYPAEQRMDVVYHLFSMANKHGPLSLKVKLDRHDPRIPSVTPIWRGAEFQEREVYDLYGVTFEGHPDLRRILMWEGFKGHPMRKDYVVEDQDVLEEQPS